MPACPSEATVLAFVEGELTPTDRNGMEAHLVDCDECRMLVSELARSAAPPNDSLEPALAITAPASSGSGSGAPVAPKRTGAGAAVGPVRVGDILAGKYVVERVLGMGGMGVVVAAMHRELAQRVALKFLLPAAFEAPGAQARFLREARSAASIQSEHVARVMDMGTLETGAPFFVMEYLDGVDLGEKLKRDGRIAPQLAVELVLQACEAIAEAHALGIIHRDLKPANLFLSKRPDGTPMVKVLDFGISKSEGGSQGTLTTQSSTMGSPRYMSPEQLRSARDVDARTDVWSLGVILFELVAGKPPFDGVSMVNLCTAIATDAPPFLRAVCPSAPESLERAVASCLAKDRDERMPSVAALARALDKIATGPARASIERIVRLSGAPQSQGRTIPTPREVTESHTRRNWIAGIGAAGAFALLFGSMALWPDRPKSPSALDAGDAKAVAVENAPTPTPTPASPAPDAAPETSSPTSTANVSVPVVGTPPPTLRVKRTFEPAPTPAHQLPVDGGRGMPATSSSVGQSGLLERK